MRSSPSTLALALGSFVLLSACGESQAPVQVELPVVINATGPAQSTTDLGYTVVLTEARIALSDVRFMSGENEHSSRLRPLYDLLVPTALAHPGHSEGGVIHGELTGSFEIDLVTATDLTLGPATLLATDYTSATFTLAALSDQPEASFFLAGTASRNDMSTPFTIAIAAPAGREITGIRFEANVPPQPSSDARISLRLTLDSLFREHSLFDTIDFAALASHGELHLEAGSAEPAYLELRRRLLSHDHVEFQLQE